MHDVIVKYRNISAISFSGDNGFFDLNSKGV